MLWVGNPVMRDQPLHDQMVVVNDIFRAEAAKRVGIVFVDTHALFAGPDGAFTSAEGWRAKDGVHYTILGGDRLAAVLYNHIQARWHL